MRIAWVFNLDADEELARPDSCSKSAGFLRRKAEMADVLGAHVAPGDVVLDADRAVPETGSEFLGQAWCPTPSALRLLRQAQVRLPAAPSFKILQTVNHRSFAATFSASLPGAAFTRSIEEMRSCLESKRPFDQWLCKRAHGFSGRGHRRIRRSEFLDGSLHVNEQTWIERSFTESDGLQVEPRVERVEDFGLHGWIGSVDAGPRVLRGRLTVQQCDEWGRWIKTRPAREDDLDATAQHSLFDLFDRVAARLHGEGYFGPFGIDAFTWKDSGEIRFHPLSEINARYSMGWFTGMGHVDRGELFR